MRKVKFFILALMASCGICALSCSKPEASSKNNGEQKENPGKEDPGKEDPGKEDPGKDEPKGTVFEVTCPDGTITFTADDVLGVYPADGIAEPFTTSGDLIDGSKATFSNEEVFDSDAFFAVYPYSETDLFVDGVLSTLLPFEHSVDNIASHNVSLGVAKDGAISLRNALGFLKVTVTESDFSEIVVRSNDVKAMLAGKAEISLSDDGIPVVEILDGVPFVTLVPGEGQEKIPAGEYLLPVNPAALAKGVSVRAKTGDAFESGYMYVREVDAVTVERAATVNLGDASKSGNGVDQYKEYRLIDDAGGFDGCYREYGTGTNINVAPNYLAFAGDYDLATYWNMPAGNITYGNSDAYDEDGQKTIRGSYLRLDLDKASGTSETESIIFEYSIAYDPETPDNTYALDWAPWTLKVREYSAVEINGGWQYGTIQTLTVEEDSLPWTNEYNNRYVSDAISHPKPDREMQRLILCCSRTRLNNDHELMPKDAIEGVTYANLEQVSPESRWALAELHVWAKTPVVKK